MGLHGWTAGAGPAVLCVHETATTGAIWRDLAAALEDRATTIAYDRRGWGRSATPETYLRTTIAEQAADAAGLIDAVERTPRVVCGAGIGAVVALELLLRHVASEGVGGAVLVEPPLLAFVPEATEALSTDVVAMNEALTEGGPGAGLDLYLSGRLGGIGAGTERLPRDEVASAAPLALFAELGTVAAWPLPLAELAGLRTPLLLVVSEGTPAFVRRAAEELDAHIPAAELRILEGAGPPHVDRPGELAEVIAGLVRPAPSGG